MNKQSRIKSVLIFATVAMAALAFSTPHVNAAMIAGVDFESSPGATGSGNFDRSPDDLNAGDGITLSTDWTLGNTADLRYDGNAQAGLIPPSSIAARFQTQGSWSITIPDNVSLDLTEMSFLTRAATESTIPTSRQGSFNTSLDGGPGGTLLWENTNLIGRPTWTPVSVDLSGSTYQGLTDTTVTFYWYSAGGIDLDTIVLSGTASVIPEPSTFALSALGLFSLALVYYRRRRKA